jgi:hypothetical protein
MNTIIVATLHPQSGLGTSDGLDRPCLEMLLSHVALLLSHVDEVVHCNWMPKFEPVSAQQIVRLDM